jgi:hypothetical protein
MIMKKVRFLGATPEQISWGGNDDPNPLLTIGEVYEVEDADIRSWHTKVKLVGIEGRFNSVSFEDVDAE